MKTFRAVLAAVVTFGVAVLGMSMVKSWSAMKEVPAKVESKEDKAARIEKMLERARAKRAAGY